MPTKRAWTDAENTRVRQMRAERASWDVIAATFGVANTTAREQGTRIGACLPPPDYVPERDMRRGALPAGHPDTWDLLTAGTVLEGSAYAYRPPLGPGRLTLGARSLPSGA